MSRVYLWRGGMLHPDLQTATKYPYHLDKRPRRELAGPGDRCGWIGRKGGTEGKAHVGRRIDPLDMLIERGRSLDIA
ncbi:hypothetical protein NDU88_006243 [Pleurodeles waltl]|uniref:Uncharacterized protein n=1 Tax=Pleurodeles waltl TaxID=8319 RepID=A0AAV7X0L7_PLEWA|nr:hypothetical protein NDU88_006243 [Pleurodeles waltl]